ncbi:MAG: 4-(cytidine 5'-diphospho)-2-C-methyl-D-erythritol kinase [Bacteroidales bacterium]|jgi:4-diphosphocytidyl-2-C-methyl-D-erythritol kinase
MQPFVLLYDIVAMIKYPNAKINIGLQITEKLSSGYHNISSCIVPINFVDILEINVSDKDNINMSGISIGNDNIEENLCYKAIQLLRKDFEIPQLSVNLHKNIPSGAGLGGGSADAAFTLKILNSLLNLNCGENKLQYYASKIGSDCPFFIRNKPCIVSGTGTEMTEINLDLSNYQVVLVFPEIKISTKSAYGMVVPKKSSFDISQITDLPVLEWKNHLHNDFETPIFKLYPVLQQLKDRMYDEGALYAAMSGSGSAIYGIFDKSCKIGKLSEFEQKNTLFGSHFE